MPLVRHLESQRTPGPSRGVWATWATTLRNLKQHEEALAVTREVVGHRRAFVAKDPEWQVELATSLNRLGGILSDLGTHEAALGAMQEAIDLIWPWFLRKPHAYMRAKRTDAILRSIRALHEALGRAPSAVFVERETSFALLTSSQPT